MYKYIIIKYSHYFDYMLMIMFFYNFRITTTQKTFKLVNIEVWRSYWVLDTAHLPIFGALLVWLVDRYIFFCVCLIKNIFPTPTLHFKNINLILDVAFAFGAYYLSIIFIVYTTYNICECILNHCNNDSKHLQPIYSSSNGFYT